MGKDQLCSYLRSSQPASCKNQSNKTDSTSSGADMSCNPPPMFIAPFLFKCSGKLRNIHQCLHTLEFWPLIHHIETSLCSSKHLPTWITWIIIFQSNFHISILCKLMSSMDHYFHLIYVKCGVIRCKEVSVHVLRLS